MSMNSFGHLYRFTTWGESHGKAIGVTIDGCPPRVDLTEKEIQNFLKIEPNNSSMYHRRGDVFAEMNNLDLALQSYEKAQILKEKFVEEYKHLFHYVTTIQGNLRKNISLKDIIISMMPGGSVIGCPKIRTLELLNNQENDGRNIFTGSFGYIKFCLLYTSPSPRDS